MKLGSIIEFRKDLYFEGAVQADWFYNPQKSSVVAENFVFHGSEYFGIDSKRDSIDTISLVKALSEKLSNESANPRSLAIADYGTGKSHLAVTLAHLFSGPDYMPETYNHILNNIGLIDKKSASEIRKYCNDRNFVIVLNGIRDFNLHSEILKGVQKSLKLYGLPDNELRSLNKTIETATIFFERNIASNIGLFEKYAKARGWRQTSEELAEKIRSSIGIDDVAFEIINDVYEDITGQRIRWEEGISAKAILEMLLSNYCGLNGSFDNVIILFDEFGRFLEYASGTDSSKCGDSALQQLFEVSQNASGSLHLINFIQADIKSYLLRVDQSRNLSRYIGRFDESEKYHISSNLETVFANLISRKDRESFDKYIRLRQSDRESEWKFIFNKMNDWMHLTGLWADYGKFRKVVVEGIYPLHPISTFMLTQLSDYMQNRSSMTMISEHINRISAMDVDLELPIILPAQALTGDLYSEMLAAEVSGRHRSQYCTQFDNIIKKNGDKLSSEAITVLQANLIARVLHFNTRNYDEARESLAICSGLDINMVDECLHILVEEYATMAFDEQSGCFDFTEDAKGAYDYKILKNRLIAQTNVDFRLMLSNAKIQEITGISQLLSTHFGIKHKITSNEWCFQQNIVLAEDVTVEYIEKCIDEWRKARSVITPKGQLIWVYINKDTDYKIMDQLKENVKAIKGMPIVFMLLNDADSIFGKILAEYEALNRMDETTRIAYNALFLKDQDRIEENLKKAIDNLRKERLLVSEDSIESIKRRLPIFLTDVFENLYPDAVSYNFDGLLTNANNFAGKGVAYYCQIMKMLLSNKVNYDTIHDYPIDIRNRISALFRTDNNGSWKCINNEYSIVPPLDEKTRNIYNYIESKFNEDEQYDCSSFYEMVCMPPFGVSEEAATMLMGMVIANFWYNLRTVFDGQQSTINVWKDLVVEDKKLHIDVVKNTTLIWVDTGSIEAKFQQLFKKIDANTNLDDAERLDTQLNELIELYGLPETQEVYKRVADSRFKEFRLARGTWQRQIEEIQDALDNSEERANTYKALETLSTITNISVRTFFGRYNIEVDDSYKITLESIEQRARGIIEYTFKNWLDTSLYCKGPDQMNNFERFCDNCARSFMNEGYSEYAQLILAKKDKELKSKQEIKERRDLIDDGKRFIQEYRSKSFKLYDDITEMLKRAIEMQARFTKYSTVADAKKYDVIIANICTELSTKKETIDNKLSSIWDEIFNADSVESITTINSDIDKLLDVGLPETDIEDLRGVKQVVDEVVNDVNDLGNYVNDRKMLMEAVETIRKKYNSSEMEYDFMPVVEEGISEVLALIRKKDLEWQERFLNLGDKSRSAIRAWKERISALPLYLSESTIYEISQLDAVADEIESSNKIEDVLFYFEKLSVEERKECIRKLTERI